MPTKLQSPLKQARRVKGVSLRQVEKATGVSNAYLSQIESGAVKEPSPRILHKLATYYGISYPNLMTAAGYVVASEEAGGASSDLMFMGEPLTPEEGAAVAAFIQHMRERTGKKRK